MGESTRAWPVRFDPRNNFRRFWPRTGVGLSVGCFIGAGYGVCFGLGRPIRLRRNQCFVLPSLEPFAQDGLVYGCFCGVVFGAGFGSGVARGLGFAWTLKDLLNFRIRGVEYTTPLGSKTFDIEPWSRWSRRACEAEPRRETVPPTPEFLRLAASWWTGQRVYNQRTCGI
ncbi:hypothetical protein CCYA_CCYA15G3957 [Cyanidiococcus yangmingshanensis]|nr:hypothetical protein CCYA_CCYA15G3957 [Cyanidiococcus yangmingshanensis]